MREIFTAGPGDFRGDFPLEFFRSLEYFSPLVRAGRYTFNLAFQSYMNANSATRKRREIPDARNDIPRYLPLSLPRYQIYLLKSHKSHFKFL